MTRPRIRRLVLVALTLFVALGSEVSAQDAPIGMTGRWLVAFGDREIRLALVQTNTTLSDGGGPYTVSGYVCAEGWEADCASRGWVSGQFSLEVSPSPQGRARVTYTLITLDGMVEGDTMEGTLVYVIHGNPREASFTGVRQAEQTAEHPAPPPSEVFEGLPPERQEEILAETERFHSLCLGGGLTRRFYDCRCEATRFMDRRIRYPNETQSSITFDMAQERSAECVNEAGVAAYYYPTCISGLASVIEDIEAFCTCYANANGENFVKLPGVSPREVSYRARISREGCMISATGLSAETTGLSTSTHPSASRSRPAPPLPTTNCATEARGTRPPPTSPGPSP